MKVACKALGDRTNDQEPSRNIWREPPAARERLYATVNSDASDRGCTAPTASPATPGGQS
jgi:hypothetical protein